MTPPTPKDAAPSLRWLSALVVFVSIQIGAAPAAPVRCVVGEGACSTPYALRRGEGAMVLDVVVQQYRLYNFYFEFQRGPQTPAIDVTRFVGTGQTQRYLLDSSGRETPQTLAEFTRQELDFMNAGGMVEGQEIADTPTETTKTVVFVSPKDGSRKTHVFHLPRTRIDYTPEGAGTPISVRLGIQAIGGGAVVPNDVPAAIESRGTVDGGRRRAITSLALVPGEYRIQIATTAAESLPAGVETALLVTYDPRVVPLGAH